MLKPPRCQWVERTTSSSGLYIAYLYPQRFPQARPALFPPSAMTRNVFSVPIFFIVFRETLEASIIVSVLLGLVEQIVHLGTDSSEDQTVAPSSAEENDKTEIGYTSTREAAGDEDRVRTRRLIRKMRFQECPILLVPRATLSLTGLFRSSLDPGSASSLPWRLARHLLPSGSPRLQTSMKNPKNSGRVRPRLYLAQTHL